MLIYGKSEKHQDMRDALAEAEIPNSTKKSVILVLNRSEFVNNNASSAIMRSFSSDYEAIFVLLEGSVQYHDEFKAFQTRRISSGFSGRVLITTDFKVIVLKVELYFSRGFKSV